MFHKGYRLVFVEHADYQSISKEKKEKGLGPREDRGFDARVQYAQEQAGVLYPSPFKRGVCIKVTTTTPKNLTLLCEKSPEFA